VNTTTQLAVPGLRADLVEALVATTVALRRVRRCLGIDKAHGECPSHSINWLDVIDCKVEPTTYRTHGYVVVRNVSQHPERGSSIPLVLYD
jgi:hypothetical protein